MSTIFSQMGNVVGNQITTTKSQLLALINTAKAKLTNVSVGSGTATKVVWAGGSSSHYTTGGSAYVQMPLNSHHVEPDLEYIEIISNTIHIKKAGLYRLSGYLMQHCASTSARRIRLYHNDVSHNLAHMYEYGGGWSTHNPDYEANFNVGDTFRIHAYVSVNSNTYVWHSHSYHTRVFFTYLGDA